ncbi:MAG: polysaccharide pyruvyl transferase family protein, partial [Muribaculaceae bacterium]|nr:polysaccharide pyruvyl transferase family protein [Muribaculaceae bacterium]
MNIAIITQPLGMNIGGILQNWALQKTLIAMGHNPVTINYRPVDAISLKDRLRIPARNVRTLLRRLNKRHDRFMKLGDTLPNRYNLDFIADEINTTDRCDKYSVIDGCDAYITGSDQVWRPRYNKGILADKFLEFTENTDCRRIAYAASFGTNEWEFNNEQTQKCRQLLKKFHKVSVREDSGITLCRRYLDHDAELVADPTLLVGAADYLSLCGKIENCGHTVSYLLDIDSRKLGIARKTAILTQSELIDLHPQRTSVRQWISSIAGAG